MAVLVLGLKDDSRLMMKMRGEKVNIETLLHARMVDHLAFLCWSKTKDGKEGTNRPASIVEMLVGNEKETNILKFESGEEFEEYRNNLLGV